MNKKSSVEGKVHCIAHKIRPKLWKAHLKGFKPQKCFLDDWVKFGQRKRLIIVLHEIETIERTARQPKRDKVRLKNLLRGFVGRGLRKAGRTYYFYTAEKSTSRVISETLQLVNDWPNIAVLGPKHEKDDEA